MGWSSKKNSNQWFTGAGSGLDSLNPPFFVTIYQLLKNPGKKHTKPPSHGHPWLHNESVAVQLCPALQMKVGKFKALWRRLHPTMAHRSSSNGDLQHVTNRRSFDPAPNIGRFFIMFNPSVAAENHVSSPYGIDLVISLAGNYPILGALDVPKSDAFPHFPSKK